jgi:serine/threonine protein kinase
MRVLKRTKKLKGGTKLGEGSFGCVVAPSIPCNKKQYPVKTASKIVVVSGKEHLRELNEEIRLSHLLNKLDPNNKYFITILNSCKMSRVDPKNLSSRDNISIQYYDYTKPDKCTINTNKDNYNLIMPYAGSDLANMMDKPALRPQLLIMGKNIKFIAKHLLTSLKILHKNHIVHQDIKLDNITCDFSVSKKKIKCALIDFGLAYDVKHFGLNEDILTYLIGTPGYIPAESYLTTVIYDYGVYKIGTPNFKQLVIKRMLHDLYESELIYREKYIGLYGSIHQSKKITRNSIFDFLNPRYNNDNFFTEQDITELYDIYVDLILRDKLLLETFKQLTGIKYKHDVFAMGITFYSIFVELKLEDPVFLDLIRSMIITNPFKRFDIEKCLQHPFFT